MDLQGLASAARLRLRTTEAGTLEVSASGASGERTPFVLTHEGRPLLPASPGLLQGGEALCLEPAAVRVEGPAGACSLPLAEFLLAEPAWKSGEKDILEHMNEDHEDSMLRMSRHYHGVEAQHAELVAVDPEVLHVRTDRSVLYFPFDRRCETHDDVHHATVHLARTARLALSEKGT
jgi:Protein of unknown function (DUF2470)